MEFSQKIKELRLSSGLSQKELSKHLNISSAAIGHLETKRNDPTAETIIAYCDFFHVSSDYLLGVDENNVSKTSTPQLTSDERSILEDYRALPMHLQNLIKSNLKTLRASENKHKTNQKAE